MQTIFAVTEKGKTIMFDFAEKTSDMTAIEILNYYRNLYYAEPQITERGIIANAINEIFNLINRQKAEIERLRGSTILNNIMEGQRIKREAKTEAYKEFTEKLENEINRRTTLSRQQDKNVIHIIHNLLKEMVGEEE